MSYQSGTATDVFDLLTKLDAFLCKGHSLDPAYTGAGTGTIDLLIGTATSVLEVITVTLTSATAFSVSGSVSGALGSGTVGSAFACSVCSFTLNGSDWSAGDTVVFTMTPPWTQKRRTPSYGGTAAASTEYGSPWLIVNAFNGNTADGWGSGNNQAMPQWLEFDSIAPFLVDSYSITSRGDASQDPTQAPKNFQLQYWDTVGLTWATADTQTNQTGWTSGLKRTYTLATPISAARWRVYITANNGSTACVTIAEFQIYSGGGNIAQLGNVGDTIIWQAPGNDAASQVYVGLSRFFDTTGDYDDVRVYGFTGYDAALAFASQPGIINYPPVAALMRTGGAIPYWFTANGRRFVVVAKCSTVYECIYGGLIQSYINPGSFPYPLAIGGSMAWNGSEPASNSTNWRWSYTGGQHQAFAKSNSYNSGGATGSGDLQCQLRMRLIDGTWRGFSVNGQYAQTANVTPNDTYGNDLRAGLDGSTYPLFPFVLYDGNNCYGELDGVGWVSGYANTAENLVNNARINWLVVPNIFRTTKVDYFAVKLA